MASAEATFLKWAGGKRAQARRIARMLPVKMERYVEPFVGSAAVFFAAKGRMESAYLSDAIGELIGTYEAVKADSERVILELARLAEGHDEYEHYYEVRQSAPTGDQFKDAARMLYLNRAGYNGLYRTNRAGQFNVARGVADTADITDAAALRCAQPLLQMAHTGSHDFERTPVRAGDTVYCDPPQLGGYDRYTPEGFKRRDHERLRECAMRWHEAGAQVMITTADTVASRELYHSPAFTMTSIRSGQSIQPKARQSGRGHLLVLTTFGT